MGTISCCPASDPLLILCASHPPLRTTVALVQNHQNERHVIYLIIVCSHLNLDLLRPQPHHDVAHHLAKQRHDKAAIGQTILKKMWCSMPPYPLSLSQMSWVVNNHTPCRQRSGPHGCAARSPPTSQRWSWRHHPFLETPGFPLLCCLLWVSQSPCLTAPSICSAVRGPTTALHRSDPFLLIYKKKIGVL